MAAYLKERLLCTTVIFLVILPWCMGQLADDKLALLAFKSSSDAFGLLSAWGRGSPCNGNWTGVACQDGRVTRLVLENFKLTGSITPLTGLDQLRVLSLKGNALNGSLPDFSTWKFLKLFFLSGNHISGTIPESISSLIRLWRLDLANNKLEGEIPLALNSLSHLLTLRLENNHLSGQIPDLNLTSLRDFNVSGNNLTGRIPSSLEVFKNSSFFGNSFLCGYPLLVCNATRSSNTPSTSKPPVGSTSPLIGSPVLGPTVQNPSSQSSRNKGNKLSTGAIVAIVVGDAIVLFIITLLFLLYYWKKYAKQLDGNTSKFTESEKGMLSSTQSYVQAPEAEKSKLVFFEGKKHGFDLEDLLRASAEMLGKGSLGSVYKAMLEDSTVVAVKRLKEITTTGKRDFEQHMELIGRMKHSNLVQLKAYYYAKEEKLLVYDYMPNGSLYALLHGNRGPGRMPLDWTTRINIALGAARGLAYIHHECGSQKVPHGNIKSSNILLDKNGTACVADFGLALLMNSSAAARLIGYRAPEHNETKRISQKADVYSFGVLLLEILTGKAPVQSILESDGIDLPRWVQSVVREEWTAEVFDLELMRYKNIEEELVAVLQIAMVCVSQSPEQRPKMSQVVKMIEEIRGDQSPMRDESFESQSQSSSVSDAGTSH